MLQPHNLFSLFHCLMGEGNKKVRKGMLLIGSAVIWSIWRCRNSILFYNGRGSVAELVEAVKVSSWKWWLSRPSSNQCMFYEWGSAPRYVCWDNNSGFSVVVVLVPCSSLLFCYILFCFLSCICVTLGGFCVSYADPSCFYQ
jgi:hypothetical protein